MVTSDNGNTPISGFHLGSQDEEIARAPSISSLSVYKQKIDALFDDTRSFVSLPQYGTISDTPRRERASLMNGNIGKSEDESNNYAQNKIKKINNTVQDRIERMFADMAGESPQVSELIGVHIFNVHYLGSTPLQSKVTSLSGLQDPLRDLYFAYRRNFRNKNAFAGRLEISKSGLKVGYKGEKGDLEQLNPFPTIAVWSAVKFVVQSSINQGHESYAFVPLITDPDNIDRQSLFKSLEASDKKYILSHNENSHSPLFAVVMRKIGVAKQLECHGFVCQTTEDAIVIAATLYKSLMSHMSRQGHNNKKFKNRNGVSCMSITSSIPANDIPIRPPRKKGSTSSLSGDSDRADGNSANGSFVENSKKDKLNVLEDSQLDKFEHTKSHYEPKRITIDIVKAKLDMIKGNDTSSNDTRDSSNSVVNDYRRLSHLQPPQNLICSSESSVRSKVSEKIELFREMERKKSVQRPQTFPPPIPTKSFLNSQPELPKESLKRSQSLGKSLSESGDILTKVAIPRSGSFLNAGGLTRYKSIGHRNNGKKGGGSPLGFNELFNEFKVQENLHSMDEILDAIIDPEGMSFNDLKPIYKEFLLKLAVTLTKDEIFQHSKAIMKKQKKRVLRKNSTFQIKRKKIFKGASGLRMVFRMPFGKDFEKNESKKPQIIFNPQTSNTDNKQISESSVSTSSYDIRQFKPKEPELPPPRRQTMRERNSKRSDKTMHVPKRNGKNYRQGERNSASEDSDFLTLSNRLGCQNRNSSSGYVSCSECESEGCVDRCYCSLKTGYKSNTKCYCSAEDVMKNSSQTRLLGKSCKDCIKEAYDGAYSLCSCDSESCADSNKCYCSGPRQARAPPSHGLEHLKSPARKYYSDRVKTYDKYNGKTETRSRSSRGRRTRSSDSLALDYELMLQNKPQEARPHPQRLTVRSTGAGSLDALSVKKSAEMAALFADVRLSQRTDVRTMAGGRRAKLPLQNTPSFARMFDQRPLSRNASLEDTLGYFP